MGMLNALPLRASKGDLWHAAKINRRQPSEGELGDRLAERHGREVRYAAWKRKWIAWDGDLTSALLEARGIVYRRKSNMRGFDGAGCGRTTMSAPELPPTHAGWKFRKGVSGNPGGKKRAVGPAQSPDAQTEKARRNHDGLWKPGQSGNPAGKPKGTRHRATLIAEQLIDGSGELLVKKCVEMALGGDAAAMRLVIERLCPPRRERPVSLDMPSIKSASDLIAAAAALTSAVGDGEITPGEAASLSTLVANTAKAVETFELAERLTRLEEQAAAKGSTP